MEDVRDLAGEGEGYRNAPPMRLAEGSIIQRYSPVRTTERYNSDYFPMYDLPEMPKTFREQVRLCRQYYKNEPLTGTIIDIMIQFSAAGMENICKDKQIRQFYDDLVEVSNLHETIKWILLEYYLVGNAFPYRFGGSRKVSTREGRQVADYRWTVLNPEYVDVRGTMLFDQTAITLEPNEEMREILKSQDPSYKAIRDQIPKEFKDAILKGKGLPLSPDRVFHIARNKQPFERYATPFLMRILPSLRIKEKMMQMDLSTADGIINQLVTITTGNDQYPATQEDLDKLAELVNTPSKAFALLWNHTLNVKFHRPEADLFSPEKYKQINQDIASGFGITRVLIDGQGANFSTAWVSILSLIQRLEWGRNDIKSWLEREYRMIAEEQGFGEFPTVSFDKMNLQEEKTVKAILMNLYDRGVISAQTLLRETGYDFGTEVVRLTSEKDLKGNGILVPQSPWQQSGKDTTSVGVPPAESPGRPVGEIDTTYEEREIPSPKGAHRVSLASLDTDFERYQAEEYLRALEELFGHTRAEATEVLVSGGNVEEKQERLRTLLLAFVSGMESLGERYLRSIFDATYYGVTSRYYVEDDDARQRLGEILEWNHGYVQELGRDLSQGLLPLVEPHELTETIDEVFLAEAYRLPLFAREGVKKSTFEASLLGHRQAGYTRAIWHCTFGPNSCETCMDRHGRVFIMSEIASLYPAHVGCQCFIEFERGS